MKINLFPLCLIIALLAVISTGNTALKPRWTPPKPESVSVTADDFRDCITVKFVEGSGVRMRDSNLISLNSYNLKPFNAVINRFKVLSIYRLFSRSEPVLDDERESGQLKSGKELADLNNYYRIIIDKSEHPEPFIAALLKLMIIETAYAVPIPSVAVDIDPETPDFTDDQGYLYEAPEGVNAPAAWEFEGGTGEDVKIIDIEGGWTFDHEDFREPFFQSVERPQWVDHGTAVFGVMIGGHNEYGIDGICPGAEIGGYSVYDDLGDWPNVADGINETAAELDEGDIFLIELHAVFQGRLSPMETWQDNFDAIETASANGIIPVQAGGNGNSDLDAEIYEGRFDPENRHSGAILVGAGCPPSGNFGPDRSRCSFSNYGQRVDLQGWGREVTTAGYGNLFFPNNDQRQKYTSTFSGTSSATPIVAGSVACVQGMYKARTGGELTLNSMEIRDILVETGTPQNEEGRQGHIGPRPDLEDVRDLLIVPGILYGTVTDVETEEPLEGVSVTSHVGFEAVTDEGGYYRIDPIIAEMEFTLTALLEGYNDSTLVEIVVEEDDSLEVNFAMLHPEFVPSEVLFEAVLDSGQQTEFDLRIENQGNGLLSWRVEKSLPGNAGADPWEFRENFYVGDSLDDVRIMGVAYVNDHFYVSGANDRHPTIYILDREGNLIDTLAQPIEDRYGMRDLTYDGELIWGSVHDRVYGITPNGEVINTFVSPYNFTTNITWDPIRECLWLCGITNDPVAYTRDGQPFDDMRIDRSGFLIYGLSIRENDPDDYHLYIQHENRETDLPTIHKVNVETGDTAFVAELIHEIGGSGKGAFITNTYDIYSWVFLNIADSPARDGGDRIDVWQIEGNTNWFNLDVNGDNGRFEAESGIINPDEFTDFILTLDATNLHHRVPYTGELHFWHNATGLHTVIETTLEVLGIPPIPPFELLQPIDDDTLYSSVVTFEWEEFFDPDTGVIVEYGLWLMSEEDSTHCSTLETQLDLNIDTLEIAVEYDCDVSWWVVAYSGEDSIFSNDRFSFHFLPNEVNDRIDEIPVEFGLRSVYPNPFNSVATIEFGIDRSAQTDVTIHDITGRSVHRLYDAVPTVGYHRITWDASEVPSGIYLLRIETASRYQVKKIIYIR